MTRPLLWVLDENHNPVPVKDVHEWGDWIIAAGPQRIVAQTRVRGTFVSTVFVGIDYNFSQQGDPLPFETMLFGRRKGQRRYATWDTAAAGHEAIVAEVRSGSWKETE